MNELLIFEPNLYNDRRGYFSEVYNKKLIKSQNFKIIDHKLRQNEKITCQVNANIKTPQPRHQTHS